jgi:ABC-type Na+ transport system ATPase subunit NatA
VFGFLGPTAQANNHVEMVMGFLQPDGGDIVINGFDLKRHYETAMGSLGGMWKILSFIRIYRDGSI